MVDSKIAVAWRFLILPAVGLGQSISLESMTDEELQSLPEEQINEQPYLPMMTRVMAGSELAKNDNSAFIALLATI
jgi:hypothetical protein